MGVTPHTDEPKNKGSIPLEPGVWELHPHIDEPKNEDNTIKNDFDLLTYNIK